MLKRFLGPIQSSEDVPFFETKMAHLLLTKMFGTNDYYYFDLHIDPFHWEKIFKKFFHWIRSYEDAPFFGPKWPLPILELFQKVS